MKKKILVALIFSVMIMAAFIPTNHVLAETKTVYATSLNNNSVTDYVVLDSPTDICKYGDTLYISTANGLEGYPSGPSISHIFSSENLPKSLTVFDGLTYISGGNICFNYEDADTIEGNYTAISAYDNTLYALRADNTLHCYSYNDGAITYKGLFPGSSQPITHIASAGNECFFVTVAGDGYTNVNIGNRLFTYTDEQVLDIEFNGDLYLLTASKIIRYVNGYATDTYPIVNAKQISISDRVYVLTRTGSVLSISLDLTDTVTLMASSGEVDWFYSSPVSGETRLGKIYVADSMLNRVAVIDGESISYITGLNSPVAVTADNNGKVYVAHYGNRIACYENNELTDEIITAEIITDIKTDHEGNLHYLTEGGDVKTLDGQTVKQNVTAFEYQNGWHYLIEGRIGKTTVTATDFCIDVKGNIFAADGNTVTAIVDGEKTVYQINRVQNINAIAISKVQSSLISYGDLILFDKQGKRVLTVSGDSVGSANVNEMYPIPSLGDTPNEMTDTIIGVAKNQLHMFARPVEGQITMMLSPNKHVILCPDIDAPQPFVYCIIEDTLSATLVGGYVYSSGIEMLDYTSPAYGEAKVNTANTPIYKYPALRSPIVATYAKDSTVTLLPFVQNYVDTYGDGWYTDAYGNKWYRIAYGEKEGYVLAADTNVNFFADVEMPKPNATITKNATLYRYDAASKTYVEFEAAGLYIAEGTRVMVEVPFDTSRKYTKVVFYRDGYGTIDVECYVKTEFVDFDGVDIIKIIASVAIAVAIVTLVLVVIYKRKSSKKDRRTYR